MAQRGERGRLGGLQVNVYGHDKEARVDDKTRAQSIANLLYDRVTNPIQRAADVAGLIRQAIADNNLNGHFSSGERAALQTFVENLVSLAGSPVVMAMKSRYVPSHRGRAITIPGVNDG